MKPGEIITKEGNITINKDLKVFTTEITTIFREMTLMSV